jgi:hypothetical protein
VKSKNESSIIGWVIGWTAIGATLIVTPFASYDPINVPKLAVISSGGFVVLAIMLANRRTLLLRQHRNIGVLVVLFILDLLLVLLLSGTNPNQEFFGTYGRATGFVAYVALSALLLGSAVATSHQFLKSFTYSLIIAGGLSIGYGLLQTLGADPIQWANQYSPVIGFLGNPNFQSSFVGFSGVLAFAFIVSGSTSRNTRFSYGLYLMLAIFVISSTDSQQGLLVLAGGVTIVSLIWVSKSRLKFLTIPSLLMSVLGGAMVVLGSLNSGPLASLLYKESVTYRGDYWRAGWKMTLENPILGVGLDSFGDWYRRMRTIEATLRRGPEITSNSAHNVLLDFSSNGGFPLVIIYIALMALVVASSIKLIMRMKNFDPFVTGLVSVWLAYQAQSMISLNQLGLAVWGWIISGLIIGYELHTRIQPPAIDEKNHSGKGRNVRKSESVKVAPATLIAAPVGLALGLLAGLPPFIASAEFKSAMTTRDADTIERSAYFWPQDQLRFGQVAILLKANNLDSRAQEVIIDGLEKFPNEFGLWRVLSELSTATPEQITDAKKQMKRLDPLNPELK